MDDFENCRGGVGFSLGLFLLRATPCAALHTLTHARTHARGKEGKHAVGHASRTAVRRRRSRAGRWDRGGGGAPRHVFFTLSYARPSARGWEMADCMRCRGKTRGNGAGRRETRLAPLGAHKDSTRQAPAAGAVGSFKKKYSIRNGGNTARCAAARGGSRRLWCWRRTSDASTDTQKHGNAR